MTRVNTRTGLASAGASLWQRLDARLASTQVGAENERASVDAPPSRTHLHDSAAELADRAAVFERHRIELLRVAYRIVGSGDDGEDLVQETSLRWLAADGNEVRSPKAWLVAVVRRLAIDRLRQWSANEHLHLVIAGPDRVAAADWVAPDHRVDLASDLAEVFLALRERLTHNERVAFVLREAFGCEYGEMGRVLEKNEVACRQIVRRARKRVRIDRRRFVVPPDERPALIERFVAALATGNRTNLLSALADHVPNADWHMRRNFSRSARTVASRRARDCVTAPGGGRRVPATCRCSPSVEILR